MGINKGAWDLWYSELGLHRLSSQSAFFILRWMIHPFILCQACDSREAVDDALVPNDLNYQPRGYVKKHPSYKWFDPNKKRVNCWMGYRSLTPIVQRDFIEPFCKPCRFTTSLKICIHFLWYLLSAYLSVEAYFQEKWLYEYFTCMPPVRMLHEPACFDFFLLNHLTGKHKQREARWAFR